MESSQACGWEMLEVPKTLGNMGREMIDLVSHQGPSNLIPHFVGVEYVGPPSVTQGCRAEKRSGFLFAYLHVLSVLLEESYSLNTDSVITMQLKFTSRRGAASEVFSDNGATFSAAADELNNLVES